MTLGSLFDGSGGFPLAGMMNGITPVWASEVEPFPIRVTTKRIPQMKHYGDVSQISGADIEPVDIITFGSPCQDLSVAGKREGLDGDRSGLFRQAIRIIKEMREKTNGMYPTFAVWENVPGALSSGREKGEDFRIALESFCKIIDHNADVPRPEKWSNAGEILGDGYSIAWRILDAQYWGVAQRRRRIFLVADLAGQRAGKVLFESEGLSGYTPQGFRSWQGTAGTFAESTGTPSGILCLNDQGGQYMEVSEDVSGTLRSQMNDHPPTVLDTPDAIAAENHSADSRITVSEDGKVQTLTSRMGTGGNNVHLVMKIRCGCEGGGKGPLIQRDKSATLACNNDKTLFVPTAFGICSKDSNAMKSDNPKSGFYEADTSRTLDGNGGNPTCNQGGIAVVCVDMGDGKSSVGISEERAPTLATTHGGEPVVAFADTHAPLSANDGPKGPSSQMLSSPEENFVCETIAIEGNGARPSHQGKGYSEDDVSFTLNATEQHGVDYGIDRSAFNQGMNAQFGIAVEEEVEPTIVVKGPGAVAQPVYPTSKNSYHTEAEEDIANTLVATDYKDPPTVTEEPYYIVRRLTPTECARLQGFPDWWCSNLGTENLKEDEIAFWSAVLETENPIVENLPFWRDVFDTYARINGKKPRSDKQILKWLKNPHTDSAEYKMWGNGVALPCVDFVLRSIVEEVSET